VIPTIARGADILVHEVIDMTAIRAQFEQRAKAGQFPADQSAGLMNHMLTEHSPPEEVGRVAKAAGVKLLVLSHLVIGNDAHAQQVILDGIRKEYAGPVVVGHDLQEF
jgi:ribonuclease BN (tRNA processing enzyme)